MVAACVVSSGEPSGVQNGSLLSLASSPMAPTSREISRRRCCSSALNVLRPMMMDRTIALQLEQPARRGLGRGGHELVDGQPDGRVLGRIETPGAQPDRDGTGQVHGVPGDVGGRGRSLGHANTYDILPTPPTPPPPILPKNT